MKRFQGSQNIAGFKGHKYIFLLFLIVHVFIFRHFFPALPDIWAGESTVTRFELYPIFDWGYQFTDQLFTNYTEFTANDEIRLSYSFWTNWVTYAPILPLSLMVLNALSGFLLYGAFYLLGKEFFKDNRLVAVSAFSAALSFHLWILYCKLPHFYTLVIGFALFGLSSSLTIRQLFFSNTSTLKAVLVISATLLLNPAIHFHILYYIELLILGVVYGLSGFWVRHTGWKTYLRQGMYLGVAIILTAFVPYVLYISYVQSLQSTAIINTIGIDYSLIDNTSQHVLESMSFETNATINAMLYGVFLRNRVYVERLFLVGLTFAIINYGLFRYIKGGKQRILALLFQFLSLMALWMSLGYTHKFSFHSLLQSIAKFVYDTMYAHDMPLLSPLLTLIFTLVQILRFPSRFSFLYWYAFGMLLTLSLTLVLTLLFSSKQFKGYRFILGGLIIIYPVYTLTADYQSVLLSGDFQGYMRPYEIPEDLKQIKEILLEEQDGRMFILPTLESNRVLYDYDEDGEFYYDYIDRLLIYYVGYPSFYYGGATKSQNKYLSYMVYQAILLQENWWVDILSKSMDVHYVLYVKGAEPRRPYGAILPEIESLLPSALEQAVMADEVMLLYEGDTFVLYEIPATKEPDPVMLVNQRWDNLIDTLRTRLLKTLDFEVLLPVQTEEFVRHEGPHLVYTDEISRVFYDLYGVTHSDNVFGFDNRLLPFDKDLATSVPYTYTPLSLFAPRYPMSGYNEFGRAVTNWVNTLTFDPLVMLTDSLYLSLTIDTGGTYRLLLRGSSIQNEFKLRIDDTEHTAVQTIDFPQPSHVEFVYYAVDVELSSGTHFLALPETEESPFIFDALLVLPAQEAPDDFNAAEFVTDKFVIKRTAEDFTYEVIFTDQ